MLFSPVGHILLFVIALGLGLISLFAMILFVFHFLDRDGK